MTTDTSGLETVAEAAVMALKGFGDIRVLAGIGATTSCGEGVCILEYKHGKVG